MMDNQAYLIKRGWKQDESSRRMWVDPFDNSRWSMSAAVSFQQSRDAAHLDTALAALELAQAALASTLVFLDADEPSLAMSDAVGAKAREALAAVRAAREGHNE